MINVTPEQQNEHLQQFYNKGSSCLCNTETYRKRVRKGALPSLGYPHTENSHPLANDSNGSNFWTTKDSMDPIWDTHDSKLAAHELGFDETQMKNGEYYRFDDNNPQEHILRIATGHEPGVNEYFTGKNANGEIDPELYQGKISSGLPEAVSDRTPVSELSISDAPKTFDLPSERSDDLKRRASEIDQMAEGADKQQAITDYNQDCAALNNRIDKEQSYINGRIEACDKEMAECPKDSLAYNRTAENKRWYQDYNNELEQSRPQHISNAAERNQQCVPDGEADKAKVGGEQVRTNGTLPGQSPDKPFDPAIEKQGQQKVAEDAAKATQKATEEAIRSAQEAANDAQNAMKATTGVGV